MSLSNYPPGVSGNEPEIAGDVVWERFHEGIDQDCDHYGLSDQDAFCVWRIGLAAWEKMHELGGKFPHE